MSSCFEKNEYSASNDKSQENFKTIESPDDLLSDLDIMPDVDVESDESSIASLDASDENAVEIATVSGTVIAPSAEWMNKIREIARDYGPFASHEIVQIIRELNRAPNPASGIRAEASCPPTLESFFPTTSFFQMKQRS
jgi:hypothetical protein